MNEFYLTKTKKHRRRKCKTCVEDERSSRMDAIRSDPIKLKERKRNLRWNRIKNRYGLTQQDFDQLLQAQNNLCAICSTSFEEAQPHIDHCHIDDKVRGLLCSQCNRGIGQLKDDPEILAAAIEYLMDPTTDHVMPTDEDKEEWKKDRRSVAAKRFFSSPAGRKALDSRPLPPTKLCESDVREIRKLVGAGESQRSVAEKYEVSPSTVRLIIIGKTWKNVK